MKPQDVSIHRHGLVSVHSDHRVPVPAASPAAASCPCPDVPAHGCASVVPEAVSHRGPMRIKRRRMCLIPLVLAVFFFHGCASPPKRMPLPEKLSVTAVVDGYPSWIRFWGDEPPPYVGRWYTASQDTLDQEFAGIIGTAHTYLAISGGGENGAFGVGILTGWTETGTRPEFTMVTGISTGALIAPFAFLGSEYDNRLVQAYTTMTGKRLIKSRGIIAALTSDAFADSDGLKKHIAKFVDQRIVDAIAAEHKRGRRLFIGTANLDAMRPVMWNIGGIAASGNPGALEMIRTIMLASASLPGIFPPQYINVVAGGLTYDELHVDGGTCSQVFLYPMGVDWQTISKRLRVRGRPRAYIIRNAKLAAGWQSVDPPKSLAIAARATTSLIRTQGIGDLYRIFLETQRDGIDFAWTHIPADFDLGTSSEFTPEYMKKLMTHGKSLITSGNPWKTVPPGYTSLQ